MSNRSQRRGWRGLADADPLTSDTVWDLTELPRRLLELRGGSIGCELGQAFARLGASVSIVESSPTLVPREDPAAARLREDTMTEDGVDLHLGVSLAPIDPGGTAPSV